MKTLKTVVNKVRYSKPVRTAAQTAVGLISTNAVGITDIDWVGVASASALSAVVCLLMSLADGKSLSGDESVTTGE